MNWKTLLVPHDFSRCAAQAETMAANLAQKIGASLILLHVAEIPPSLNGMTMIHPKDSAQPVSITRYITDGAEERLQELARKLRARGLSVETEVAIGDVTEAVISRAERDGADLIVMGTHGRKGLAHLLLGSVAEKVVRRSSIPVLTVRSNEDEGVALTPEEITAQDELVG